MRDDLVVFSPTGNQQLDYELSVFREQLRNLIGSDIVSTLAPLGNTGPTESDPYYRIVLPGNMSGGAPFLGQILGGGENNGNNAINAFDPDTLDAGVRATFKDDTDPTDPYEYRLDLWFDNLPDGTLDPNEDYFAFSDASDLNPAGERLHKRILGSDLLSAIGGADIAGYLAENKAGVTIQAGQPVTVHSSGSGVVLAQANSLTSCAVGLAAEQIAAGNTGRILLVGPLELPDWTAVTGSASLVSKGKYYLVPATAGLLTILFPTANPDVLQFCGYALSAQKMFVNIEPGIGL